MGLDGRVVIVTGASAGLGEQLGRALAACGAVPVLAARRAERLRELAAVIPRAEVITCDVTREADRERLIAAVIERHGRIDGLVNNAGMTRDKVFVMMSEEDWNEVIRVNLTGAFNFARAAAFMMMKAKRGSILNITSVSGLIGLPGQANYSAAKAGLIGLTKSVAKEVGRLGVRVNALALGFIETDMTASLPEENRAQALAMIPLGRFGKVEDVVLMAAFLLSDAASYITGAIIQVDGGLAM